MPRFSFAEGPYDWNAAEQARACAIDAAAVAFANEWAPQFLDHYLGDKTQIVPGGHLWGALYARYWEDYGLSTDAGYGELSPVIEHEMQRTIES